MAIARDEPCRGKTSTVFCWRPRVMAVFQQCGVPAYAISGFKELSKLVFSALPIENTTCATKLFNLNSVTLTYRPSCTDP